MVPVLGFKRGAPAFTLGAPGGRGIISAHPAGLSNLVDLKASPQAAIEAPRVHTEGGEVLVSARVGDKALAGLAKKGHKVAPKHETYSTPELRAPGGDPRHRQGPRGRASSSTAPRPPPGIER